MDKRGLNMLSSLRLGGPIRGVHLGGIPTYVGMPPGDMCRNANALAGPYVAAAMPPGAFGAPSPLLGLTIPPAMD